MMAQGLAGSSSSFSSLTARFQIVLALSISLEHLRMFDTDIVDNVSLSSQRHTLPHRSDAHRCCLLHSSIQTPAPLVHVDICKPVGSAEASFEAANRA
jgi:hypothetical protein